MITVFVDSVIFPRTCVVFMFFSLGAPAQLAWGTTQLTQCESHYHCTCLVHKSWHICTIWERNVRGAHIASAWSAKCTTTIGQVCRDDFVPFAVKWRNIRYSWPAQMNTNLTLRTVVVNWCGPGGSDRQPLFSSVGNISVIIFPVSTKNDRQWSYNKCSQQDGGVWTKLGHTYAKLVAPIHRYQASFNSTMI